MGTGSLKRIAALCLLATFAVWAGGALSVPAQISVPGTTVTAPTTTVTVPSTTVRVPSTTTTASTPSVTVTTPKPAPKVTTPTVKAPAPKPAPAVGKTVEKVTKKVPSAPSGGGTSGSGGGVVKKTIDAVGNVGGTSGGSGSGTSGSGGGVDVGSTVGGLTGSLADTATGAVGTGGRTGSLSAAGGPGTGAGLAAGPGGMTFLAGAGGGGGTAGGAGGGSFGSGSGAGSLAAMLSGAGAKELRAVLAQLEGCLPALPAGERRVLSMRAGLNGAPLSRGQVAQRLGVSRNAVRTTERRALNRLQLAAANTGCAVAVVGPFDPAGIGNLAPQLVHAGAVAVSGAGSGDFAPARGIVGRSASPLFDLGGGSGGGPAWAIILFTVLLSVSVAALTRELRQSL